LELLPPNLSNLPRLSSVLRDIRSRVGKLAGTDYLFLSIVLPNVLNASEPARDDAFVWPCVMNALLGLPDINYYELTGYKSLLPIDIFRVLESLKNFREVGL